MNSGPDNSAPDKPQDRGGAVSPREAAMREVLQVISASRSDPAPVFEVILRNAARLCGASMADLDLVDDDGVHLREIATYGPTERPIASENWVWRMDSEYSHVTAIREGQIAHVPDLTQSERYLSGDPMTVAAVEVEKMRTGLAVPLLNAGRGIGCLVLFRQVVKPFSPDEIALVETFAAQAVIAIENVRQFREVQDRLRRERASAEILGVISRSPDDETQVFDKILSNAGQLCEADTALLQLTKDGMVFTQAAIWAEKSPGTYPNGSEFIPNPEMAVPVSLCEQKPVQIEDLADDELYRQGDPVRRRMVDDEGIRTFLAVPLLRNEKGIGAITLSRRDVRPFNLSEISLIETFAAQAVIAIENVRQFREVQDRLERERASKEILHVISQSRDDEQPVFEAIVNHARRLCDAATAVLVLGQKDDPCQRLAAHRGLPDHVADIYHAGKFTMDPATAIAPRAILDRKVLNLRDMAELPEYRAGDPRFVAIVEDFGARSNIVVPLILDGKGIGALFLPRREVRPYTDDEVALVESFAAQAVIAIENARQFRALEKLNTELGDRVAEQVDELERLGRLKRFLPAQVADAVVSSGDDALLSSHRAMIATLFCDIRGFTAFCENAEPEETIEVLQTYHEALGALISDHGAGVDHRAGDGIMVIFNDPLPCDDPAGDALRLAFAMRARMADLCTGWKRLGHHLGFGVGISLGYATVGLVGTEGRFDYTASGTAVNLAARLCEQAADGEILLSPRAAVAVEGAADLESAGELALKGFREPVSVKRVIGLKGTD